MDGGIVDMEGKKPFSFTKWAKSRKGQQVIICVAFMTIPLLLLFVFTYLPFAEMVKFSFYKMKYLTPVDQRKFVGFKNYIDVFRRDDCFGALKLSLYYMVGAIIQLVLALYLATILSFKVKGGNFFKGLMFFPYLISGIAIGFIFKFFYTRGFVLDTILQWCGFKLDNLPYWLKDQSINNWSLVATSVWRYFGQNMVLFIGAIMSVDADPYEAAELDGANKFQQFKHIILPSIKTKQQKTKVVRKRSTHKLFAEREVHRLKDIPEKDMWKVAFEPSRRTCLLQISGRTCKLIMRRKFSYIARSSQK